MKTALRRVPASRMLEPDGDQLNITLKGDLAGMLSGQRQQEVGRDWRPLGLNRSGCAGAQPAEFGVLLDGCIGSLPVDAPDRIESFTSDHEPASELENDLSRVWRTGGCFWG